MFTITVSKYANSRHWAVYLNGRLLAVTVYKKGAQSVADTLSSLLSAAHTTELHAV